MIVLTPTGEAVNLALAHRLRIDVLHGDPAFNIPARYDLEALFPVPRAFDTTTAARLALLTDRAQAESLLLHIAEHWASGSPCYDLKSRLETGALPPERNPLIVEAELEQAEQNGEPACFWCERPAEPDRPLQERGGGDRTHQVHADCDARETCFPPGY